jgi:hypothetical protein
MILRTARERPVGAAAVVGLRKEAVRRRRKLAAGAPTAVMLSLTSRTVSVRTGSPILRCVHLVDGQTV